MVCDRCKTAVKTEFEKLGFNPVSVTLGEVEIASPSITIAQRDELKSALHQLGFELLEDRKKQIVAQVKATIIELVHYATVPLTINLSAYLSEKLDMEYATLSAIFSESESLTIEKFIIKQKIEKVKELLTYGEKSLSEIAFLLNYSSVAHLSAQFKKVTGETPSTFKKNNVANRETLDKI
ncbi:MAG: AraC family transcriptional regulator [Pedobacter sp.]|nr:MAG: AraC family transcriptional regulator [Pedobacter sp.]